MKIFNSTIDLFWPQEQNLYVNLKTPQCPVLLELGCGSGQSIGHLATIYPQLTYYGAEEDSELFSSLDSLQTPQNVTTRFFNEKLLDLSLEDAFFDVVIIRQQLSIHHNAEEILLKAYNSLKPDGHLIVLDNDYGIVEETYPQCPALEEIYNAYCQRMTDLSLNPKIGRKLPSLLEKQSFHSIQFHILSVHNTVVGDVAMSGLLDPKLAPFLAEEGYLRKNAIRDISEQWKRMLTTPGHSYYRTIFASSGSKKKILEASPATSAVSRVKAPETVLPSKPASHPDARTILEAIRKVIADDMEIDSLTVQTDLPVNESNIDSIAVISVSMFIKETWAIDYTASQIYSDQSLSAIAEAIHQRLTQDSASSRQSVESPEETQSLPDEGSI